jgi:hypothetical protein
MGTTTVQSEKPVTAAEKLAAVVEQHKAILLAKCKSFHKSRNGYPVTIIVEDTADARSKATSLGYEVGKFKSLPAQADETGALYRIVTKTTARNAFKAAADKGNLKLLASANGNSGFAAVWIDSEKTVCDPRAILES